jgi:hypothetical protein
MISAEPDGYIPPEPTGNLPPITQLKAELDISMLRDELDEVRHSLRLYEKQLDEICELLTKYHPIGAVKHIGRLEAADALREMIEKPKL